MNKKQLNANVLLLPQPMKLHHLVKLIPVQIFEFLVNRNLHLKSILFYFFQTARIKARASSGRNRQFPYTDDYVDLDDLEKQSKTPNAPSPPTTTTGRRSTRGGRSS